MEEKIPTQGQVFSGKALLIGGVLFIAALLGGYALGKEKGMNMNHEMIHAKKGMDAENHEGMSMNMTETLRPLKGDFFDKAFLEMMIVHHQDAVEMAKLIPTNAEHQELKALGENITREQQREIDQMKKWLQTWGYYEVPAQSGGGHNHP